MGLLFHFSNFSNAYFRREYYYLHRSYEIHEAILGKLYVAVKYITLPGSREEVVAPVVALKQPAPAK